LVGKPEGSSRQLGRPRHRWEDHTEMSFKEIRWVWIGFMWLWVETDGGKF
jgi:hypothetical protein